MTTIRMVMGMDTMTEKRNIIMEDRMIIMEEGIMMVEMITEDTEEMMQISVSYYLTSCIVIFTF